MGHVDEATAFKYISGFLDEEENLRIDGHMAECGCCADYIGVLLYTKSNFLGLWESWSAVKYEKVYIRWQLLQSLLKMPDLKPSFGERIFQWIKNSDNFVEISMRFLLDSVRKIASSAGPAAFPGYRFSLRPAIAGIGTPEAIKVQENLEKGSYLLEKGQTDEAIKILDEAAMIDARALQSSTMDVFGEGKLVIRFQVDSRKRRADIMYWPDNEADSPPFAFIHAKEGGAGPLISELQKVTGAEYLLAEFSGLSGGEFRVFVPRPDKIK